MERLTTLIQTRDLAARLQDPGWVVLDTRFELGNPGAGRAAWQAGHIPGAGYAHLDEDLSSPIRADTGRHPLPDPAVFAERLGSWGIGNDSQVVAYDAGNAAYASRLWWLMRWLGHAAVAVLDGGFAAWQRAGLPVDTSVASRPARRFVPRIDNSAWLTTPAVSDALERGQIALVDARGADRFEGRNETIDPVAGHVPGARSHPFTGNLDGEGRFLPAADLRRRWSGTLAATPSTRTVCMCGSGVTACQNLLALEIAGLPGARLYAGSWSEWIRDPSRPVATGSG